MHDENRKTTQGFWDSVHEAKPRARLPSLLVVTTRDLQRLLSAEVRPGMEVLEVGFAPGKQLAYLAAKRGVRVAGLDYSQTGVNHARELFSALGLEGDFRCEDAFQTSFEHARFDVVYSVGVIEHFEDPREFVRLHVELARPGGTALILIPDYGGIYGKLQRHFDADNLAIHNLKIMNPESLEELAPRDLANDVRVFRCGRINPWQVSWHKRMPRPLALLTSFALNAAGVLQPFDVGPLCPMLALRIVRKG
jgi:2-polyprenyl-3-methyl-5-hydroxy-6-metoxy-1,4-benzoquinol methylase